MRFVSTLLFCLLGSTALAAECDRWTASMQEEEVGPLMTANICVPASSSNPEFRHELFIQCAGEGNLWMRYIPFAEEGYPPGGDQGYETEIKFSLGRETFAEPARYEDMDGAMAMDTTIGAPLISAMMREKQLVVSDAKGKVPGITFPLNGAREALEELIKNCKP
jgi:hypothetical protein